MRNCAKAPSLKNNIDALVALVDRLIDGAATMTAYHEPEEPWNLLQSMQLRSPNLVGANMQNLYEGKSLAPPALLLAERVAR